MQDDLHNDVHIKSVLAMLPYEANKVAGLDIGLEIRDAAGHVLAQRDHAKMQKPLPVGSVISFLDANKHRVRYKLIADSDAKEKPENYAEGHDAAAFVEVDAKGNDIKNAQTGNPHVIVSFPGANRFTGDWSNTSKDRKGTSYQETFFNGFIQQLAPALLKHGATLSGSEVIAYGIGDTNGLEYAVRYGAKTMLLDAPDKTHAAERACMLNVLRDHLGRRLSDTDMEKEYAQKMRMLSSHVTEITSSNLTDVQHSRFAHIGKTGYYLETRNVMMDTLPQDYLNLSHGELKKRAGGNIEQHIKDSLLHPSMWGMAKESMAENLYLDVMENQYDVFKAMDHSVDKKASSGFEKKIDALREKLSASGVGNAQHMEDAAKLFLNPNELTFIKAAEKAAQKPASPQR